MEESDPVGAFWDTKPQTIRAYLERSVLFEELAVEISYSLKKSLQGAEIEYSAVTWRVKTLNSFCEKAVRKDYQNPIENTTDIAGVRLVYLYASDRERVDKLVCETFRVTETVVKAAAEDAEHFGYGAVHYLVKLGDKTSGPRYDHLADLVCEIQVRTVLQDAWAIIDHHLRYKKESSVPDVLKRKLNALVGLFETADDQFDKIKEERFRYISEIGTKLQNGEQGIIDQQLNLDSLAAFLKWKLPARRGERMEEYAQLLLELDKFGIKQVRQLDSAVNKAEKAVAAYERDWPPVEKDSGQQTSYSAIGVVRMTLRLVNDDYLRSISASKEMIERIATACRVIRAPVRSVFDERRSYVARSCVLCVLLA